MRARKKYAEQRMYACRRDHLFVNERITKSQMDTYKIFIGVPFCTPLLKTVLAGRSVCFPFPIMPAPNKWCFYGVQVITQYQDSQLNDVLAVCEKLDAHLTAAVVSNDMHFLHTVLGQTINGTTYAGLRAKTTGKWFGIATSAELRSRN